MNELVEREVTSRRRLKVLFIGICNRYINPTNWLIPPMLRLEHEVLLYGPGYVSDQEVTAGLDAYCEKHGDLDFVITDRPHWDITENDVQFIHRYTVSSAKKEIIYKFALDAGAFLSKTRLRKIIFLTALDVYAISEKMIATLLESEAYFVTEAGGFSRPLEELEHIDKEEYYTRKVGSHKFGLWHGFVTNHGERFINMGHFVGETEFNWSALDNRKYVVSVPGQLYYQRGMVQRRLKTQGYAMPSGRHKLLFTIMDHIGLRPYAKLPLLGLYNLLFQRMIAASRYAYTEGFGFDRPIRKFFEIPALGTVLLCSLCAGFNRLGFLDRQNCVVVSESDVVDAIRWLEESPDTAQRIADAGRLLIWRQHSIYARAAQFRQASESILAGRYCGTEWQDGRFVVREKRDRSAASSVP